jgi:PhoD related phosphatase
MGLGSEISQTERNWFIEQLQLFAQHRRIRISFLSGDVHCAGVGVLKTLQKGKGRPGLAPAADHRYMLNVVTSMYRRSNLSCHV